MEGAMILIGGIAAVIVLVLVSSTHMRTQEPRGPQGQWGPAQGLSQWTGGPSSSQPGNYTARQRQSDQGNLFGSYSGGQSRDGGSGLLQFFAVIGVLVVLGACALLFLALQSGIQ